MALDYELHTEIQEISNTLEDYTQWYIRLSQFVFYPEVEANSGIENPGSFLAWIAGNKENLQGKQEALSQLAKINNDLMLKGNELVSNAIENKQPPLYDNFSEFSAIYEEFIHHLWRLKDDIISQNQETDALTGLRNETVLYQDLEKEMERLKRQGREFAFALLKIDDFPELEAKAPALAERILLAAASVVKRNLRSYDDGYRMKNGMFVLAMKQTSVGGGSTVMARIKKQYAELRDQEGELPEGIDANILTCVAQPFPGDSIQDLIQNLKQQLNVFDTEDDLIIEHREISALEKFAQQKNKTNQTKA